MSMFQHIARNTSAPSRILTPTVASHDLTAATGAQYIHSFDRLWFLPADLTSGRGI